MAKRGGGGFSPPPPTTPRVRVRTGRFIAGWLNIQCKRNNVLSQWQDWRLSPRRLVTYPCRGWLFETSVTGLLFDHDVRPFTISQALPWALGSLWPRLTSVWSSCMLPCKARCCSFVVCCSGFVFFTALTWQQQPDKPGYWSPGLAHSGNYHNSQHCNVRQISLDKLMNFRDTTTSFTVPAGSPGFVILC